MRAHSSRLQQHLTDLKTLADLLGGIADRLPRCTDNVGIMDPEAVATMHVALPKLTATCNALFETLNEECTSPIAHDAEHRESAPSRRRSS